MCGSPHQIPPKLHHKTPQKHHKNTTKTPQYTTKHYKTYVSRKGETNGKKKRRIRKKLSNEGDGNRNCEGNQKTTLKKTKQKRAANLEKGGAIHAHA
jgi:hypothetical protein